MSLRAFTMVGLTSYVSRGSPGLASILTCLNTSSVYMFPVRFVEWDIQQSRWCFQWLERWGQESCGYLEFFRTTDLYPYFLYPIRCHGSLPLYFRSCASILWEKGYIRKKKDCYKQNEIVKIDSRALWKTDRFICLFLCIYNKCACNRKTHVLVSDTKTWICKMFVHHGNIDWKERKNRVS